jgi:Spy/CpxP family protein refolding chaperone
MSSLRDKLVVTLGISILGGLAAGLAVMRSPAIEVSSPQGSARGGLEPESALHGSVIAELGLDERQAAQIERLRARERDRVERLQRALAATEQELRREELAQPFDAERVNALVARRAELTAYLRGTESRVVSEIARLLTSEQRRRFAELRAPGTPTAPRAAVRLATRRRVSPVALRSGRSSRFVETRMERSGPLGA